MMIASDCGDGLMPCLLQQPRRIGRRSRHFLAAFVSLVDGSIVEETEQPPATDIIPLPGGPLPLDSPDALRRALAVKPDFTSANGKGFHFVLERSPEGLLVITVRGVRGRMPAIVSPDATTGEVLVARALTFRSGGILYSADAGRTWHASDLVGKMVTAITADPLMEDQAYAVIP